MNLEGFKNIPGSFVVNVDKEIKKKDSEVECKGRRCDLILWTNKKFILIEAKSGPASNKAKQQLVNTREWLKKHINISKKTTCHLILIAESIPSYQSRKFLKKLHIEKIRHIKPGENIFEHVNKINN